MSPKAVTRIFLGWEESLVQSATARLLAQAEGPLYDLRSFLLVVPTRQAGRRLRSELARQTSFQEGSLLAPQVVTPVQLFRDGQGGRPVAGSVQMIALTVQALRALPDTVLSGLGVHPPAERSLSWCRPLAESFLQVRKTLEESAYSVQSYLEAWASELEEVERWRSLAAMEKMLLAELDQAGLSDPLCEGMRAAQYPQIPDGVESILLLGLPDPVEPALRVLQSLRDSFPIEVWIHAPHDLQEGFDAWGRPCFDFWKARTLPFPPSFRMAGSVDAQVECVLDALAHVPTEFGPSEVTISVPDTGLVPALRTQLLGLGFSILDPSGQAMSRHPLLRLLDASLRLMTNSDWFSFSDWLRCPDVLDWLFEDAPERAIQFLRDVDRIRDRNLPSQPRAWLQGLGEQPGLPDPRETWSEERARILAWIDELPRQASFLAVIERVGEEFYAHRQVGRRSPADDTFRQVAKALTDAGRQWERCGVDAPLNESWALVQSVVAEKECYSDPDPDGLALEGWLEMAWSPSPILILTGLHEGFVPDTRIEDPFLPETLRKRTGLPHDEQRFARDAFLYESALRSREVSGQVHLVSGRTGAQGDPLRPSRLLLSGDPQEVLRRANLLFDDDRVHECLHPPRTQPDFQWALNQAVIQRRFDDADSTFPVRSLGVYLQCPFQFFLDFVLKMNPVDPAKNEMNAADFGQIIHQVMELLGEPKWGTCEDPHILGEALTGRAETLLEQRFGTERPLFLRIQLDAMKQRLRRVAEVEAALHREGWRVLEVERSERWEWEGISFTGRIDRIDQHRSSGEIRVIDYKTGSTPMSPSKAHLAKGTDTARPYRILPNGKAQWTDLQLPIYTLMTRERFPDAPAVTPCYFSIPRAVRDTTLDSWTDLTEADLESARKCCRGVVREIRDWRFWPPTKDQFSRNVENVLLGEPSRFIDGDAFEKWLDLQRQGGR